MLYEARVAESALSLCKKLILAETTELAVEALIQAEYWEDPDAWLDFDSNENNRASIGNQQSSPVAALVEKLVNAVDAVLMGKCMALGIDPQGSAAPRTIRDAVAQFFGAPQGDLSLCSRQQRVELSRNAGLVAIGSKRQPSYIVYDRGEGQVPSAFPDTFLSLSKSNKLRIPFVQGKFNMGGTGVLPFCGTHHLQLIASRRNPNLDSAFRSSPDADMWGFTIVRRQQPTMGERSSKYTYLAPRGEVLCFRADSLSIPGSKGGEILLPFGTAIKLFEFALPGLRTAATLDLYYALNELLYNPALPLRIIESRDYKAHDLETNLSGLRTRLLDADEMILEDGFPSGGCLQVGQTELPYSIYALRAGRESNYLGQDCVSLEVNGQKHGGINRSFLTRKEIGLTVIARSVLVSVDCSSLPQSIAEDLFMNSRDRLREVEAKRVIERQLTDVLSEHPGLRALREKRKRELVEKQLADSKPIENILKKAVTTNPALLQLLGLGGANLKDPFRKQEADHGKFIGKKFPTYFRWEHEDQESRVKDVPEGGSARLVAVTDASNDYFVRASLPGRLAVASELTEDLPFVVSKNLWNGMLHITVRATKGAQRDEIVKLMCVITDDQQLDPFELPFNVRLAGPRPVASGTHGRPRSHNEEGDAATESPPSLGLPRLIPIGREQWSEQQPPMDKGSSLRLESKDETGLIFVYNKDNIHLLTELKRQDSTAAKLVESRYAIGLALVAMALVHPDTGRALAQSLGRGVETVGELELVSIVADALSPIILPMIDVLGELKLEDVAQEEQVETYTEDSA